MFRKKTRHIPEEQKSFEEATVLPCSRKNCVSQQPKLLEESRRVCRPVPVRTAGHTSPNSRKNPGEDLSRKTRSRKSPLEEKLFSEEVFYASPLKACLLKPRCFPGRAQQERKHGAPPDLPICWHSIGSPYGSLFMGQLRAPDAGTQQHPPRREHAANRPENNKHTDTRAGALCILSENMSA